MGEITLHGAAANGANEEDDTDRQLRELLDELLDNVVREARRPELGIVGAARAVVAARRAVHELVRHLLGSVVPFPEPETFVVYAHVGGRRYGLSMRVAAPVDRPEMMDRVLAELARRMRRGMVDGSARMDGPDGPE